MKLYIRQKIFSWSDQFFVWNEAGEEQYYVQGEIFSLGKRLHIMDQQSRELAVIQQKLMTLLPRYTIYVMGQEVAEVVKQLSLLRARYSIERLGWEVYGDLWAHEYEIVENGNTIVRVHKQWMTWGDCYELEIMAENDDLAALAVVLAIDCATDSSN